MRLTSSLSFPHLTFKHWVGDVEAAVLIVKGAFGVNPDGQLGVLAEQPPLVEVDEYYGDAADSSLRVEQEIAPAKTATDIIIRSIARSPSADEPEPRTDWPVGIEVIGRNGDARLNYKFHVRGPSEWHVEGKKRKWVRTDVEPVTEVPLRYEFAYGGALVDDEGEPEPYAHNPVGIGRVDDARLDQDDPIPAPQIGDLAEFTANDINAEMTVHGVGPMAKWWLPRRSHAGTFDDAWKATRHPRMPDDYSFAYWNAAHPRLQLDPKLEGGETVRLLGFQHSFEPIEITIPPSFVAAHREAEDGPMARLQLDTVEIDVESLDRIDHRVTLIWRGIFANPDEIEGLFIRAHRMDEEPAKDVENE